MLGRAAVSFVALISFAMPAYADAPAPTWKHDNPFCGAEARVAALSDGSGYAVALSASGGNTIDAHVALVGDTDAYDANLTAQPLVGTPDDRETAAVVVRLPTTAKIGYFFVDSYAIDGGKRVDCPSYVFEISPDTINAPPNVPAITPQHLQALAALSCGHVYIPPSLKGQFQSAVGDYGNKPLTVLARAYVDSNGYSIREKLLQSSGVEGVDQYQLGALHEHQFAPAKFLCTPVVSTIDVELHYSP